MCCAETSLFRLFSSDYTTLLKLIATIFANIITILIFVMVFHRILDFKTGLDFYPGPFLFLGGLVKVISQYPGLRFPDHCGQFFLSCFFDPPD